MARWLTVVGSGWIAPAVAAAALAPAIATGYPTSGFTIWTIGGSGSQCTSDTAACGDGGPATAANLTFPRAVAVDAAGDVIVADSNDNRIRRITPSGTITTIAGTGTACASPTAACGDGGPAANASFNIPYDVAVDGAGNVIVADEGDNRIRRFTPGGDITTIAGTGTACASPTDACGDGGAATSAELNTPEGVAVDGAGNIIVADVDDNRIRRFAPGGNITTIAGTGTACASPTGPCGDGGAATAAELSNPLGVLVDREGNVLVSDAGDEKVRSFTPGGNITTIAGTGTACSPATAACGDGGAATSAALNDPFGLALDGAGNLLVADPGDNRIRWLTGPQAGPSGPPGPPGAQGAQGPAGPPGKVELVTCRRKKTKRKKTKQVCKGRLVSGRVKFKTAGVMRATLSRGGVVYASGLARRSGRGTEMELLPARQLKPGRYTLRIGRDLPETVVLS